MIVQLASLLFCTANYKRLSVLAMTRALTTMRHLRHLPPRWTKPPNKGHSLNKGQWHYRTKVSFIKGVDCNS